MAENFRFVPPMELLDQWESEVEKIHSRYERLGKFAEKSAIWGAIEALFSLSDRMGNCIYRYQFDDGSLSYEQAEQIAYEGLKDLQQHEADVEFQACYDWLYSSPYMLFDPSGEILSKFKEKRRPTPKSLKQRALEDLALAKEVESLPDFDLIRAALEQLPDEPDSKTVR